MPLSAAAVEAILPLWPDLAGGRVRLINYSENETFLVEGARGQRHTVRIHRPGYQDEATVGSELSWLQALRSDTSLPIPEPVRGHNGTVLQRFTDEGTDRLAVAFRFIEGTEPTLADELEKLFTTVGAYAAQLHLHVTQWQPPAGFTRQRWDSATILAPDGLWGDWRLAPGVDAAVRPVLDRLCAALATRLGSYGQDEQRYGLIHADMRLGNLLVNGEAVTLIDFDDCGFCWFAYDFAAAISFHETDPAIPALRAAWLGGYRAIRSFTADDEAALDSMVMLRRMALLAWIGSHAETALAQRHAPGFAEGTAMLAARYLSGPIWR